MKKLFTLLTLALISIGSAWGEELCSANLSTVTNSNRSSGSADGTNCTISWDGFSDVSSTVVTVSGNNYIKLSNDTKKITLALTSGKFQPGDILTASIATTANTGTTVGFKLHQNSNAAITESGTKNGAVDVSYTLTATDIESDGKIYILRANSNSYMYSFSVTGTRNASALTVQFDAGSHGTYTPGSITEESANDGITLPALSTVESGYSFLGWFTDATEGTKIGDAGETYYPKGSSTITLYAQYSALSAPTTVTITPSATSVEKNAEVTLAASADGTPAPAFQWYSNTTNANTGGTMIDGATSDTYSPATTSIGTTYYYVVAANASGSKTSDTQAIEVVGSSACKLNQVIYSNTFDAFILEPTTESNGKVKAYYLDGTAEPTISSYQISENASYSIDGSVITVTAENGVSTTKYDITVEAVTPYDGAGLTFDGSEAWVKTGNAYSNTSDKQGWVISRNAKTESEAWERESPGKNRIYMFLAPSKSFSFTNGGTKRAVKVYVNGTEKKSADSDALTDIEGNEDNAYMVAIVSNQTSGDGAIKSISISKSSVSVLVGDTGWSTYSSAYALDFGNAETGIEAYTITSNSGTTLTTNKITGTVAANTGLLVKGTANTSYNVPVVATGDAAGTNLLVASVAGGTVSAGTDSFVNYVLVNNSGTAEFQWIGSNSATLGANKAYLSISGGPASAHGLFIDIDSDVTGIKNIKVGSDDNIYYDLQGRRVLYPTKGLYIVNGKKVIVK